MNFYIYRDLRSIAFVRCLGQVPSATIHAEGTGFSVRTAMEKCRSEAIEAEFQLDHSEGRSFLGIAAHPILEGAAENAWNETLESLLLQGLSKSGEFRGILIPLPGARILLGRIQDRYAALICFQHRDIWTATQAVSPNPLKALLKAWTEVRNIRIFNPPPCRLDTYTKANRHLSSEQLANISLELGIRKNPVATSGIKKFHKHNRTHHIVYFKKETT